MLKVVLVEKMVELELMVRGEEGLSSRQLKEAAVRMLLEFREKQPDGTDRQIIVN